MNRERDLSTLERLFGDNTSGEITPQDLRDLATSMLPGGGRLHTNPLTSTAKAVAERSDASLQWSADTPPIPPWQTICTDSPGEITIPTTGIYLVILEVMWSWDYISSSAQKMVLELLRNGSPVPGASSFTQMIATSGENDRYSNLSLAVSIPLWAGDTLNCRLYNPDPKNGTTAATGDCVPKRFITLRIA